MAGAARLHSRTTENFTDAYWKHRSSSMADAEGPHPKIPENPLVVQLIARGVGNDARLLRGFIGPSASDDIVTLYQRLDRLSDKVEITRDDVLFYVEAPASPLGGVILWVKKDADICINRLEESGPPEEARPSNLREFRKGRLRMNVRARSADVCQSFCMDCLSWCSCNICQSLPQ
jgi:hypothetical protein